MGDAMTKTARNTAIILAYQPGVTMTQIAEAHGISRERVRQILRRAGIEQTHNGGWVPADPEEFRRRSSEARVVRNTNGRGDALYRWRTWRRNAVVELKALAAKLGRTPTYGEVADYYGLPQYTRNRGTDTIKQLGGRWIGYDCTNSRAKVRGMHRWYRLAGLTPREPGGAGHRAMSATCRRCGANDWYLYPSGRHCRPCGRRQSRERYQRKTGRSAAGPN